MKRGYELIIFDWDGTLADTTGEWVGILQQMIQEFGLPERTPAQLRELVGLGIQEVLARLFPELDPARVLHRIRRYRRKYGWPQARPRLFEGARAALEILDGAGFTLAVATGESRRRLDRALHETGCRSLFRVTRCADESASKPAPGMLSDILLRTATEPASALMVGDTDYDMTMAHAAGIDALGVSCGVHGRDRLQRAGAVAVIADVPALPAWLSGGYREPPSRQGDSGLRQQGAQPDQRQADQCAGVVGFDRRDQGDAQTLGSEAAGRVGNVFGGDIAGDFGVGEIAKAGSHALQMHARLVE
jgi:phosphoglycolate phosphatase